MHSNITLINLIKKSSLAASQTKLKKKIVQCGFVVPQSLHLLKTTTLSCNLSFLCLPARLPASHSPYFSFEDALYSHFLTQQGHKYADCALHLGRFSESQWEDKANVINFKNMTKTSREKNSNSNDLKSYASGQDTPIRDDLNAMIRGRMESNNKNNHGIQCSDKCFYYRILIYPRVPLFQRQPVINHSHKAHYQLQILNPGWRFYISGQ